MAADKRKTEKSGLAAEIAALAAVFVSVYLLLSLATFSLPLRAGLFPSGTGNWGGALGYFIARMLTGALGMAAFFLPFVIIALAFCALGGRLGSGRLPAVLGGGTVIHLAVSALFAAGGRKTIVVFGARYPRGGIVGHVLAHYGGRALGQPGFVLFMILLLLLAVMVTFEVSIVGTCRRGLEQWGRLAALPLQWWRRRGRESGKERVKETAGGEDSPTVTELPVIEKPEPREPKLHAPVTIDNDESFTPLPVAKGEFTLPPVTLLDLPENSGDSLPEREHYLEVSRQLVAKLKDFGVNGTVEGISPGPVVTTYEFAPAPGVKISRVVALENDLALGLKAQSVRIVGSVPGKAALGIEIPNPVRQMVYLREIIGNREFTGRRSPLTIGLGKDVVGKPVLANLADMPHLLIAGATGAGKSVGLNTIICSILLKASPDEVRLLMVDPKRIELSSYDDIPHLLHPVVVDPKLASRALQWAVLEMERRYGLMEEMRVKNITTYNEKAEEKLPLIVIIIDELADLMMVASKDVEASVARLAQMARAAGMHMILATQRPSVDVLTGLIKANFPTRISFKVSSKIDSRTILDQSGAEHLLGKGDMLFMPPGASRLQRIHCAYVSEKEIGRIVDFLKSQGTARYDETVLQIPEEGAAGGGEGGEDEYDEKYDEAVEFVCESGQASISMVQRRLRVGYNRAARMIEMMEREGIVGPADGAKPREVLVRKEYT